LIFINKLIKSKKIVKMQVTKDNPSTLNTNDLSKFVTEENRHKNLEIPLFELE
jgi:hypothetical protein